MSPEMLEKYENSSSFKYDILREPITALTMCVHAYDDENKILQEKKRLVRLCYTIRKINNTIISMIRGVYLNIRK